MKRVLLFLVLFLCAFSFLAKEKHHSRPQPRELPALPVQTGMVLSVALDDDESIKVPLEENPTTGFQWEVEIQGNDFVRVSQTEFLPAVPPEPPPRIAPSDGPEPAPARLVGAGGMKVFTVRAVREGTAVLRFRHRRSWEKDIPAEREFTLVVFVTKD